MTDTKSRLQRGDTLLRAGRHAEAVAEYSAAANAFIDGGFALKAAAILRQVVDIVDRSAPELTNARTHALRSLLGCYTALGLVTEAEEIRRLLR